MIIDCHTHWGTDWEQRTPGDPSHWLSFLDKHKVDRCFFMGTAGLFRADQCAADNNNLALMASRTNRLIPIGTAWPTIEKAGVVEARRCLEQLKMKGLKFHPWLQGFSTANPYLSEMCVMAGEVGVPVLFHDGTPCYSLSEQIAGLALRHPKTSFVLLHSGMLWNWRSALEAARLPNVWLTLCGPHLRALDILASQGPRDRLLWGSDFGFGLADQIEYRLNLLRHTRISRSLLNRILGVNPMKLIPQ